MPYSGIEDKKNPIWLNMKVMPYQGYSVDSVRRLCLHFEDFLAYHNNVDSVLFNRDDAV